MLCRSDFADAHYSRQNKLSLKNLFTIFFILFLSACQGLKTQSASAPIWSAQNAEMQESQAMPKAEEKAQTPYLLSRNLDTIQANKQKIKVALFFPFSGKNKDLGVSLYNAALLSLFDNDTNHNIELVLIDSKDSIIDAKNAAKEIINQNIKIVIGPVFSNVAEAVVQDFLNNSITAISLSNNQQLSGKINNKGAVFIAGFLPEQQIEKIVGYEIDNNKMNFAILAPNNQYGITISNIFKRAVKNKDGRIITSEFYTSDKDMEKTAERIVNAFLVPPQLAEGKGRKIGKDSVIKDSDRAYAQAILVPESGKNLSRIAALLKQFNKDERDFQLIGTSQWDEISTLNDGNLIGALFAAPTHQRFASFERAYYQTYNKFPPRIASISYDSLAAISQIIDKKGGLMPNAADFVAFNDPQKNAIEGIDGQFRFLGNGLVQRNFAVLRVGNGEFETVEKPMEKFLKF